MSINLLDLANNYLKPETITKVSKEIGVEESKVQSTISSFIPLILGSVVNKNSSAEGLLHTLKSFGASRGLSSLSTTTAESPILSQLLTTLFGSNQSDIISKVSEFVGINADSTSKLFNLTSEATLGSLGKYANDHNLGETEFSSLLDSSKSSLAALLPAGLSLGSLGLGNLFGSDKTEVVPPVVEKVEKVEAVKPVEAVKTEKIKVEEKPYVEPTPVYKEEEKSSIWKWLLPLLLLLIGGFLVWKYLVNSETTEQDSNAVIEENVVVQDPDVDELATKSYETINLDGVELLGYSGGLEEQIILFANSPEFASMSEDELKEKWFNFDNVNFVFGTTDQLEGDSTLQLENLAKILQKYPNAKIKIGAYTDRVGDDAQNKELSQKRADYLKDVLTKLGVGAQVIGAEGYGEEFSTVDEAASDEERAADRKMSLRFTK